MRRAKSDNQRVQLPRDLPQGERKALADAQSQIPLPDQDARLANAAKMAQSLPQPNLLGAESANPGEPLTAGMSIGPGAGPEAQQALMMPQQYDQSGMAAYLPMLEALADRPEASSATRNYVRRLRGSLPPEITMSSIVGKQTG